MKKLLMATASSLLFSGFAMAFTQCNPTTNYLISTVNAGFQCEIGDKVYTFGVNSVTGNVNATDFLAFLPFKTSTNQEEMDYNAGPGINLAGSISLAYSIAIDTANPNGVPAPGTGTLYITSLTGTIFDSTNGSSSTLNKTGTYAGGSCTVAKTDSGGGNINGPNCAIPVSSLVTSLSVAETYTYTGAANQNGVTGFANTVGQTLVSGTPEPMSMLLFGTGLFALGVFGRKKFSSR